jgi:RNA polymerase sigma-70 factor (TIGR02957 family)
VSERDPVAEFEAHRPRLFGVAYRMLGSAMDAEDVVQEAFLRWAHSDQAAVASPLAWLVKTVTNLCLNQLSSARMRRERYVGPWLPEPVLTEDGALGPLERAQERESVSLALLVLFERLTPTERAVFVLREAFGYDHGSIAEILDCSTANSRQLYRRAAQRLAESRPRFDPNPGQWRSFVERFLAAAREGDLPGLESLLSAEVVSWSDGGGKAPAARRPVAGRARVGRMIAGLLRKAGADLGVSVGEVNCQPALLGHVNGDLLGVLVFDIVDGTITAVRTVSNPDKLWFLRWQLSGVSRFRAPSGPS